VVLDALDKVMKLPQFDPDQLVLVLVVGLLVVVLAIWRFFMLY
jgi:hypothetical protein